MVLMAEPQALGGSEIPFRALDAATGEGYAGSLT